MDHLPMPKFGPLAGLRVVFSGIEIAGPFAGQMFAEWGCGVIWIGERRWADTIRVQPELPAALPPQFARAVVKYFQR